MIGIYCIRHIDDSKPYVGQSRYIERRINEHFNFYDKTMYIDKAIVKHGKEMFTWEILELCEEEILDDRECHWIATLNSIAPNGYNLQSGGSTGRHSEATRAKLSKARKGRKFKPHSAETRKKIGDAQRGEKNHMYGRTGKDNPHFGMKRSAETCAKLSAVHKGKTPWNKGKPHTEETRAKQSEKAKERFANPENHPMYGKQHKPETRMKISASNRGRTAWNKGKSQKAYLRRKNRDPRQGTLF